MDYLPLFFRLQGRRVLVVGGGVVAARKLSTLSRANAKLTVVAPKLANETQTLIEQRHMIHHRRDFLPTDVVGHCLVVAATDQPGVNEAVVAACDAHNIWINVVDDPALSNAIFPAIIDRSPLLVAVSSSGRSPTLARIVRGWIEERLPPRLDRVATFVAAQRQRLATALPDSKVRQRFWWDFLSGLPESAWRDNSLAEGALENAFTEAKKPGRPIGEVSLIGAGPGDPELLTLKGLRLLRAADVVLYDNLVNGEILDYARRDAQKLYVGKKRKFKGTRQEEINRLLVDLASAGNRVVRLKGGDPFIFGRGGEEIRTLAEHGISFTVVPGITAAMGAASYAGIPLTHRDMSQSVRFITGHRAHDQLNLDWPELAKPGQTLVIYMGMLGLREILQHLNDNGLDSNTPGAVIERATLTDQREVFGTIANLADRVQAMKLKGPTLTIVGDVVAQRVALTITDNV